MKMNNAKSTELRSDHDSFKIRDSYSSSSAIDPLSSRLFDENNTNVERRSVVWKVVVVALLLVNGTLAGFTYLWGLITGDNLVQRQFFIYAEQIAARSLENSRNMAESLSMITNHVQSSAVIDGAKWPFHSPANFDYVSEDLLNRTGLEFVALAPLVTEENRKLWEAYSVKKQQLMGKQSRNGTKTMEGGELEEGKESLRTVNRQIFRRQHDGEPFIELGRGPYAPLWKYTHVHTIEPSPVNFNLLSIPAIARLYHEVVEERRNGLSAILNISDVLGGSIPMDPTADLLSLIIQPIFSDFSEEARVVGATLATLSWKRIFQNVLPVGADGLICVIMSNCGPTFTYQINGRDAIFLGEEDLHNEEFNYMDQVSTFDLQSEENSADDNDNDDSYCQMDLHIYPSEKFYQVHQSNMPSLFAGLLVLIFLFTCAVFKVYDVIVNGVQRRLEREAASSNKIISRLFPQEIRDVLKQAGHENGEDNDAESPNAGNWESDKARLDSFLRGDNEKSMGANTSKPIATLFPDATVLFADIAGFTAWSSVREPEYVFTLLENIFSEFDELAKRRKVFKVETIGDCYVAVTGLPRPQPDHAVIMTRFARDCIRIMNDSTSRLEPTLGPGTSELAMRIGLHSGPVTAGVLRGEKSRFQLFGDTVNLASQIESSGKKHNVHISQDTANLLIKAGKSWWIKPRKDKIAVNGNDVSQTFWVLCRNQGHTNHRTDETASSSGNLPQEKLVSADASNERTDDKELQSTAETQDNDSESTQLERLISWNADLLRRWLAEIVANRNSQVIRQATGESIMHLENSITVNANALEEVTDHMDLPICCKDKKRRRRNSVPLQPIVVEQLREYVAGIASLYGNNPFHNFQHASHVVMSMNKLLFRVDLSHDFNDDEETHYSALDIPSDPFVRFALLFSALIHDVGHIGLTNVQLEEKMGMASNYRNKSVSEQNAVNIAWKLLMEDRFALLRQSLYTDKDELKRFRQIIVNAVISTDVFDEDQRELRIQRWNRTFARDSVRSWDKLVLEHNVNQKATVVVEHIVLASYFSHAMQDWQVYQKWNELLFEEMYAAYQNGHGDDDPSVHWIESELRFFDTFFIPVARNLAHCGVLDIASDDYLNYAMGNRRELASKGEDFVNAMVEKFRGSVHIDEQSDNGDDNNN